MKKLMANRNLIQKICISIIIVLLLSFAVPIKSQATFGGTLMGFVNDLVGAVFDVITGALQAFLVDGEINNVDGDDNGIVNVFMISHDAYNADQLNRNTQI